MFCTWVWNFLDIYIRHSCYAPLRRPYENWPKVACQQQPRFTITEFFILALFFKWPYLGNETTNFKCVSAKILISSRAFIPFFMKVTSPNSFILFRPLSWKKALFRGVPGGQIGPLRSYEPKHVPGTLFHHTKKKRFREAQLIVFRNVLWPLSFQPLLALSVIFTQTAWKTYMLASRL